MILKNLGDLDKKKPYFNKLTIPAGFNIIDFKPPLMREANAYSYEVGNKDSLRYDKATIDDNIFSKLFGLIDKSKKQVSRKARKRSQKKSQKNLSRKR